MGLFPTTQWGVVLSAGRSHATDGRASLETLCRAYWYPLYTYARLGGRDPEEARDLTQGFFAHLLERALVGVADPERGSFRAFLKGSFDRYSANEQRKAGAQKRGGGQTTITVDLDEAETQLRNLSLDVDTPEVAYERHWARTLVARSLEKLEAEMQEAGEHRRFKLLSPFLTGQDEGLPYRDVAATLGVSESAVKVAVHRLRRRFGALLREEISHTVSDAGRVDEELRNVFRALGG
jgi:RNA polymerase sigma-70 factor (ECF subfamily)